MPSRFFAVCNRSLSDIPGGRYLRIFSIRILFAIDSHPFHTRLDVVIFLHFQPVQSVGFLVMVITSRGIFYLWAHCITDTFIRYQYLY